MEFLPKLEEFLVGFPLMGIAAIVDRPGYVASYAERYEGRPWRMDKTAFTILIERSAKYAHWKGRRFPADDHPTRWRAVAMDRLPPSVL